MGGAVREKHRYKMKKRSGVKKPVWVFVITLSAVVLAGLLVIAAVKFYLKPYVFGLEGREEENEAKNQTAHVEDSPSFWENVPDGQEVMAQAGTEKNWRMWNTGRRTAFMLGKRTGKRR